MPGRRAIAELAVVVARAGPAVGLFRRRFAAALHAARRHPAEAEPAGNRPRPETQVRLAVAELAVSAVAPAVGSVVGGHGAGVPVAHIDLPEVVRTCYRHGPHPPNRFRAIPELPVLVPAPAVDPVGRGHGAGVLNARAQLPEGEPAADRHRRESVGGRTVAELA